MNKDIQKYDIFCLQNGKLKPVNWIQSVDDYNHNTLNLHHYIEKQHYDGNKKWYEERGISQKLILLPIPIHEQVHNIAIKNLSDFEFQKRFKISRWDLIFNKRHTKY